MALGGGVFSVQNKKLPGSYINFVSASHANAGLSDRGIVTMAMALDWGASGVTKLTKEDAIKHLIKVIGYNFADEQAVKIREIFKNSITLYLYRLNGAGDKAENTFGTAKYAGTRGNNLMTVITANVDDENKFDVKTYLGTALVDTQTVATASELTSNDYVDFKANATLAVTAGTAFTGGTNSTVTAQNHSDYLEAIESYSFNTIAYDGDDSAIKALYTAFTKRMRDEVGVKFQCVLYNYPTANYEGVISVANSANCVPWVLGAEGGCAVNKSCTNMVYDGEIDFSSTVNKSQTELEGYIEAGQLVFHRVGDDIRLLTDINTLTTTTDDKNELFKENQTIRVLDQIGNDIATLFNTKYVGSIANNASGRVSLWSDIVKHHKQLETIGAIEDFDENAVTIMQGDNKRAVVVQDVVTVVNAMEQLYMTVTVQ